MLVPATFLGSVTVANAVALSLTATTSVGGNLTVDAGSVAVASNATLAIGGAVAHVWSPWTEPFSAGSLTLSAGSAMSVQGGPTVPVAVGALATFDGTLSVAVPADYTGQLVVATYQSSSGRFRAVNIVRPGGACAGEASPEYQPSRLIVSVNLLGCSNNAGGLGRGAVALAVALSLLC